MLATATCGLDVLYLWHGLAPRAPGGEQAATRWFGVDQWAFAGRGWLVLFVLAAVATGTAIACYPERCRRVATAYLAAALRFLDTERARLWPVAALLAAAVLFHLEALILAPSLLVLAATTRRRSGRDALGSVALVPTVLGLALWWFNDHGLPISDLLTHSQISADGGNWAAFVARPDLGYLWRQLQLLLLLAPTVVLLPALLVGRTPGRSPHVPFLATASAGGLLLVFVWRAQLGVVDDWNLYALAAQPLGLLVLGWLATEPRLRTRAPWITVMVVLAATHTAAWIAENHTPVTG